VVVIEREQLAEVAARERRFYHLAVNADGETVASVLEHGLERTRGYYRDFWESRPGHVYLGRFPYLKRLFSRNHGEQVKGALFSVDLALLEPARVNPDEDHFSFYGRDGVATTQRFRLQPSPALWTWEWAAYLRMWTPPSLGEWAEQVELGKDPATTRFSIGRGSFAYRGVVPPATLRLVKPDFVVEKAA